MIENLFIFAVSLFLVVKGATLATKYAQKLAENFQLSRYTIGFIIIAVISILPETFISINSSLKGMPSFGLGTLLGSNVSDMTIVFAIIILFAGRGMKIESRILKNNRIYPFLLLLPLILGLDGYYSRLEGAALVVDGAVFYYMAFENGAAGLKSAGEKNNRWKNLILLLLSMVILLAGAHFVVKSATTLATIFGVNPVLIGMLVVGLGTTMPELFFALKSVKERDDSLAVGDILGTVLADATIVVGILGLIGPFSFPPKIIYITGTFMVLSSLMLFYFMRSGRVISKKETYMLFAFWVVFVLVEFMANK
ncbi:sodium:calcium antiporter [Candidatus Peregrinibacteria bacterium]|nr:sodium:calcium antiporter [Candidatus Peregrinibacteria bacterium]